MPFAKMSSSLVERLLANGSCLVLFDGLDEVSQEANQDSIIQQIKDFSDTHADNQFIISCRVAAYSRWFERFTDIEMADFNDEQIGKFIQNWFHAESEVGQKCWERLQKNPQLKELASVPLLLTLLCIVYNRSNKFPPNRADLYEEAIDALLRNWDASRRITRDEVYQQLSITRKKSMFARIAWGTFSENMYFIPERILTKQIEKYIESLPGFKAEDLDIDSYTVLKSIESQHGIFVERARKVHSFAHLTFQEYFTAKYIVDNARDGTLETLINDHLYDKDWVEVFLLVASMLNSADELVLMIYSKSRLLLLSSGVDSIITSLSKGFLPSHDISDHSSGVFVILSGLFLSFELRKIIKDIKLKLNGEESDQKSDDNTLKRLKSVEELKSKYGIDIILAEEKSDLAIKWSDINEEDFVKFMNSIRLVLDIIEFDSYISNTIRKKVLHDILMPRLSS